MAMSDTPRPNSISADEIPPRTRPSTYPEPFFSRMAKREKQALGDFFGLSNLRVNLTSLKPGGESALLHRHSKQDDRRHLRMAAARGHQASRGGGGLEGASVLAFRGVAAAEDPEAGLERSRNGASVHRNAGGNAIVLAYVEVVDQASVLQRPVA